MSSLQHVIRQEKDQDVENKLGWSYIQWVENEVVTTGVANAQTQTDWGPFQHKECQTSNPVIMHIDLTRTNSKLRHSPLGHTDGLVAPFIQFDRQAPARISTSPTLRRMRSTRRPLMDPVMMESTEEEPSPMNLLSPVHRVKSPLAASPLSDGESCHDHQLISSSGRQRTRSNRSKTFENGIASTRQECQSAHPTVIQDFGFPDSGVQETELCHNSLQERRRSSVVVSLPGLDVSPGDLFVSNGAADILNGSNFSGRSLYCITLHYIYMCVCVFQWYRFWLCESSG